MFSCEFCEISKNVFFIEHLWVLLLEDKLNLQFTFIYKKVYMSNFKLICWRSSRVWWFFYVIMPIKIPRTFTENNYAGMKSLIYALAILQKIEKIST